MDAAAAAGASAGFRCAHSVARVRLKRSTFSFVHGQCGLMKRCWAPIWATAFLNAAECRYPNALSLITRSIVWMPQEVKNAAARSSRGQLTKRNKWLFIPFRELASCWKK